MNVSRRGPWGDKDDNEVLNKSQIYITTAGWKGTYAYDKLIQILVWEIVKPERACILGGTWRIPVLMGLLDKTFIKDLKLDGTFNEASFGREYKLFVFLKYRELLGSLIYKIISSQVLIYQKRFND